MLLVVTVAGVLFEVLLIRPLALSSRIVLSTVKSSIRLRSHKLGSHYSLLRLLVEVRDIGQLWFSQYSHLVVLCLRPQNGLSVLSCIRPTRICCLSVREHIRLQPGPQSNSCLLFWRSGGLLADGCVLVLQNLPLALSVSCVAVSSRVLIVLSESPIGRRMSSE